MYLSFYPVLVRSNPLRIEECDCGWRFQYSIHKYCCSNDRQVVAFGGYPAARLAQSDTAAEMIATQQHFLTEDDNPVWYKNVVSPTAKRKRTASEDGNDGFSTKKTQFYNENSLVRWTIPLPELVADTKVHRLCIHMDRWIFLRPFPLRHGFLYSTTRASTPNYSCRCRSIIRVTNLAILPWQQPLILAPVMRLSTLRTPNTFSGIHRCRIPCLKRQLPTTHSAKPLSPSSIPLVDRCKTPVWSSL